MADRLKTLFREVRANATWDFIKWIILLGVAAMSFALSRLIPILLGMPQGILINLIIFLIGLALVIVAWIIGRQRNKRKLQAIHAELDATYNKEIAELTQQKASLEDDRKENIRAIEQYRRDIQRLREDLETTHIGLSFREARLKELEDKYGWLHVTADDQAKNISKHVKVGDYFTVYHRAAESVPRIYLGFDVYNKSVLDVVIESEVKGHIQLDGDVNLRKPETMPPVPIPRLGDGQLIIDQHLSPEQFDFIAKHENDKNGVFFYFSKLEITVKIASPSHEGNSACLELPKIMVSKNTKNRAVIELKECQQHASNIEKLTLALGACHLAYKQIRREQLLSSDDYQTLKDDIGRALDGCFGMKKGDEYFSQQPPFPSTLEEQDEWVDLQCKNLGRFIDNEKK
jgi:hypothetical protein